MSHGRCCTMVQMWHTQTRLPRCVFVYVIIRIKYTLTYTQRSVYRILIQYTLTSLGVDVSVYLILIFCTQIHIWKGFWVCHICTIVLLHRFREKSLISQFWGAVTLFKSINHLYWRNTRVVLPKVQRYSNATIHYTHTHTSLKEHKAQYQQGSSLLCNTSTLGWLAESTGRMRWG